MPRRELDSASRLDVRPYDPSWPRRAEGWAVRLRDALGPLVLRVDHIGSTAIPGMAAKPVLDLQISVADLDLVEHAFDGPLAGFGFTRRPYRRDHVPAGRDDPPERWAKRMWARRGPSRESINVHARVLGAPNERLALLFRDWFRVHPLAVPAYAQFKVLLSQAVASLDAYADIKDPVVDVVIAAAEDWAERAHWSP
jgi:GrpB-like predicted nucleotidyltransferase (UPF0157 family)